MFGNEVMDAVEGSINGTVRFYGLEETGMDLRGLDRHLKMIESYKKLHAARARKAGISRSEEHTSELQSRPHLVCRLLLEKKKQDCQRLPQLLSIRFLLFR